VYRAGELDDHRKTLLDEAGMVWEPGDESWEQKLAVLRSYRRAHSHLAPRRDAVWGDADSELVPVGEHMANLRRKDGLGKNPQRAAARAAQLAEIDPDWNCPWPLDWQRHYRVLADLAADEPHGVLPAIAPGVLYEGDDLGKWLQRQRRNWAELSEEQQQRLTALGVKPAEPPAPAPSAKGAWKTSVAFQRGLQALAQYIRPRRPPPRPKGPRRRDRGRRRGRAGSSPAGGVYEQHQIEAGQTHPQAAHRADRAGRGMGVGRDTVGSRTLNRHALGVRRGDAGAPS
jgi:hypothetical protein